MDYYIGVDIGTTASKTVAFSPNGEVLASFSFGYQMLHPQPEYSEQNPDEIFKAVVNGLTQLLEKLAPQMPVFVAFSAAMHSLILLNERGEKLTDCIIWADNRSAEIAKQLRSQPEGKTFYQATGVPIHSMSPLCKLLWFKKYEPSLFQKAAKFIGIKEYVFYRLFGQYVADTSLAAATGLLNGSSLQWDQQLLAFIGIQETQLSKLVAPTHVLYLPAQQQAIPVASHVPFVIGASDGALSNLGAGAVSPNIMAVNIGTSSAARMLATAFTPDPQMRTFCYHVNDENYIVGGASNNGAVVLDWLKNKVLQTTASFDDLFASAEAVSAGAEDLLILPYILGERAPIWNAEAKAVLWGMNIQHTQAHFVRAAMEGVVFAVYSIGKILIEQFSVTRIHATGGFAKSKSWLQILANVFNVEVAVAEGVESTALGAVMIGAKALNKPLELADHTPEIYQPQVEEHAVYQKCFARYERLYEVLKNEM